MTGTEPSPLRNTTQRRKPEARRRPVLTRSSSASPRRGGGGRSSSSALQSTAASGAARQNSGVSERGLPSRPATSSAKVGAHPAKTWNCCRCSVTERKPTVRQSIACGFAGIPDRSAAVRTTPLHHWVNIGEGWPPREPLRRNPGTRYPGFWSPKFAR